MAENETSAETRKPIALISSIDLAKLRKAQELIKNKNFEMSLLLDGLNSLWRYYRDAYGLPPKFDFDWSSGAVYEQQIAPSDSDVENQNG